jgi:Flp pilus assembly protein TadD
VLTWLVTVALAQTALVDVVSDEVEFSADVAAEVEGARQALDAGRLVEAGRRLEALAAGSQNAELWRLTAVAWFEAGAFPAAEAAVGSGLALAPDSAELLVLRGGIATDQGRGDAARADLRKALSLAGTDPAITAPARYNLGTLALEEGDLATAQTELSAALTASGQANDPATAAAAAQQLGRIGAMSGQAKTSDALGMVSDAIGRGDLGAARAALPPAGADRRSQIQRWIGEAAVFRAEGRNDEALALLVKANGTAREGGLVRESAQAAAELGNVYAASGAYDQARSPLESAVSRVAGTSFHLLEASNRASAGIVAARLGDLAAAKAHLEKGRAVLGSAQDVATKARLDELAGAVAGQSGDLAAAQAAFGRAAAGWAQLGLPADAARVAIREIEFTAGRDEARLTAAKARARAAFSQSGDALGDAQIALAEAVGRSGVNDADGTVAALGEAIAAAQATGGPAGARFAAIAHDKARKLLAGVVSDPQARARAVTLGFEDIVSEYTAHADATTSFDAGTKAYDNRAFPTAAASFDKAEKGFAALGEVRLASESRRNAAWARYNAAITEQPATAWTTWSAAAEVAKAVGDPELEVRSRVAAALVAPAAQRPNPRLELANAAKLAEESGFLALAGRCHARRAELEPVLADAVAAANLSWSLTGGSDDARYALYTTAVRAYEAEDYALAVSLSERIDDGSWKLLPAVLEVRDAARKMLE